VLPAIVDFRHKPALIGQLNTAGIPLLVPGILGAVIEKLRCAKGIELEAANAKVNFERRLVAIGCGVRAIDPTKLGPVSVAQEQADAGRKLGVASMVTRFSLESFSLSDVRRYS
jgi:hypothetical protein